ncbi:GGA1, partial [Cordylochernes scorpioides]
MVQVLEETVNRCGPKFHSEVGKFRFLNELIKIVSPKYLGNRVSPRLKERTIELLYRWSMELKKEPKVFEAYQMLKKQGIVILDPVHVIKADRKMELKERKVSEIEAVHNNANVLSDMLATYRPDTTSAEEKELMKELYESCKRLRPQIFQLVSELDPKDESISDLLVANDKLTAVIQAYLQATEQPALLEIGDSHASTPPMAVKPMSSSSLLDEQLLALGLEDTPPSASRSLPNPMASSQDLADLFSCSQPTAIPPCLLSKFSMPQQPSAVVSHRSGLEELDDLAHSQLLQSLPSSSAPRTFPNSTPQKVPLNQLQRNSSTPPLGSSPPQSASPLDGLFVPLETIQPGALPPRTLYSQSGLTAVVHIGKETPRHDISVLVLSVVNKSLEPVVGFSFHAAVPKVILACFGGGTLSVIKHVYVAAYPHSTILSWFSQ